jgi:hypothetical protein
VPGHILKLKSVQCDSFQLGRWSYIHTELFNSKFQHHNNFAWLTHLLQVCLYCNGQSGLNLTQLLSLPSTSLRMSQGHPQIFLRVFQSSFSQNAYSVSVLHAVPPFFRPKYMRNSLQTHGFSHSLSDLHPHCSVAGSIAQSSPNTRVIKSTRMSWAGHVARWGERRALEGQACGKETTWNT